jgi:hypothetical protein
MVSCKMAVCFAPKLVLSAKFKPLNLLLTFFLKPVTTHPSSQAFKDCEFVFPDAPHPPSEIFFKQTPSVDAAGPGLPAPQLQAALSHSFPSRKMELPTIQLWHGMDGILIGIHALASLVSRNPCDASRRHAHEICVVMPQPTSICSASESRGHLALC